MILCVWEISPGFLSQIDHFWCHICSFEHIPRIKCSIQQHAPLCALPRTTHPTFMYN